MTLLRLGFLAFDLNDIQSEFLTDTMWPIDRAPGGRIFTYV